MSFAMTPGFRMHYEIRLVVSVIQTLRAEGHPHPPWPRPTRKSDSSVDFGNVNFAQVHTYTPTISASKAIVSAIAIAPKITSIKSSMNADPGSDSEGTVRVAGPRALLLGPRMGPLEGRLQPRPEALNILSRGSLQIK